MRSDSLWHFSSNMYLGLLPYRALVRAWREIADSEGAIFEIKSSGWLKKHCSISFEGSNSYLQACRVIDKIVNVYKQLQERYDSTDKAYGEIERTTEELDELLQKCEKQVILSDIKEDQESILAQWTKAKMYVIQSNAAQPDISQPDYCI